MTIEWVPVDPEGFKILVTNEFRFIRFLEQPEGNTLTFDEVLALNRAITPPPKENLTEEQVSQRVNDDYARSNNITITDRVISP